MNLAPLQTRNLLKKNPTLYTFEMNIEQVRDIIISGFSIDNQIRNENVLAYHITSYPGSIIQVIFSLETKQNALFGKSVFNNPDNDNDIYLHTFGRPIISRSYYSLGKPLEYQVSFQIHLESNKPGYTTVSINAIDPRVIKGIGGFGAHGFYSNYVLVEPTTIEEYELLRYIGYLIGTKSLPAPILPKK
jgi:hypothetical protein